MALAGAGAASLWAQAKPASGQPTGPATLPSLETPIAKINGHDINNAAFYNLLIQVAGMRVFQQVIDLSLAQQACTGAGIPIDGPEFQKRVEAEFQRALDTMNVPNASNEEKQKILDEVLRRQGVNSVEFGMNLQRTALLRALSKGKVDVTDQDIDEAYLAQYGDRVQAKIIEVGTLERAAMLREAIEKQKKTPDEAAQELGIAAPASWTISSNANGIDDIKKVAFAKNEGELSAPITLNGRMFMVFVEKKLPSQLKSVPKDSVKDKLRATVQDLKETQWMSKQLDTLRLNASIQINNATLLQQFQAVQEARKRQADAAAAAGAANAPAPAGGASPAGLPAPQGNTPAAATPK
jgi:hypothetical protein